MDTVSNLEKLIKSGFPEENSPIKQKDIELLEFDLEQLCHKTKGYTIPLLDTIGVNLNKEFSSLVRL